MLPFQSQKISIKKPFAVCDVYTINLQFIFILLIFKLCRKLTLTHVKFAFFVCVNIHGRPFVQKSRLHNCTTLYDFLFPIDSVFRNREIKVFLVVISLMLRCRRKKRGKSNRLNNTSTSCIATSESFTLNSELYRAGNLLLHKFIYQYVILKNIIFEVSFDIVRPSTIFLANLETF